MKADLKARIQKAMEGVDPVMFLDGVNEIWMEQADESEAGANLAYLAGRIKAARTDFYLLTNDPNSPHLDASQTPSHHQKS